ncbi:hypothetical protein N7488_010350 [Penicillium malachiteum]|nr:hypothetical protein N7488_010350 [Penicillium malachiteum]
MTRRWIQFGSAVLDIFIEDAEQDRLGQGKKTPISLEERFVLDLPLSRPLRGTSGSVLAVGIAKRSGRYLLTVHTSKPP